MKVPIINTSGYPLPSYATLASAGLDLKAVLSKSVSLKPLERVMIPTGLFMEIPIGYEGQVRPRSGLAYKHGLTVLNAPGTIDADYRGEVKVVLVNLSNEEYTINPGDRIAQLVIAKHEQITWQEVQELSDTERGAGGYGSTGKA